MNRRLVAVVIASVVAICGLVPATATAQRSRGGMQGGHGFRGGFPGPHGVKPPAVRSRPIVAPNFGFNPANPLLSGGHFKPGRFHGGGFGFFGVGGTSSVIVTAPSPFYTYPVYDTPAVYDAPPVYYAPPVMPAPVVARTVSLVPAPPLAPPAPTVVEFSSGRYELRGDGMTVPYTWVWIPNPPAAPPPSAAPESPPPPAHRAKLYRWTDDQGVIHLTDQADSVPEEYRARPKQPS